MSLPSNSHVSYTFTAPFPILPYPSLHCYALPCHSGLNPSTTAKHRSNAMLVRKRKRKRKLLSVQQAPTPTQGSAMTNGRVLQWILGDMVYTEQKWIPRGRRGRWMNMHNATPNTWLINRQARPAFSASPPDSADSRSFGAEVESLSRQALL